MATGFLRQCQSSSMEWEEKSFQKIVQRQLDICEKQKQKKNLDFYIAQTQKLTQNGSQS